MSRDLIESAYNETLASDAQGDDDPLAKAAGRACAQIDSEVAAHAHALLPQLRGAAHTVTWHETHDQQRHQILLRVDTAAEANRVAATLESLGYSRWQPFTGAASQSYLHHHDELVLSKTADYSLTAHVRWRPTNATSIAAQIFRPTAADWDFVDLPTWAWHLYSVVRPARLVLERLKLRKRGSEQIAPFLATPESLISQLLAFAEVTAKDIVGDVGCGDGRLIVAAAESLGCRAIGIERVEHLAQAARDRAEQAGVADRVRIDHGDLETTDLGEITVLLLFLPIDALAELLPTLLATLPSGARIVAHELTRFPAAFSPQPHSSELIVAPGALTVAHRWVV